MLEMPIGTVMSHLHRARVRRNRDLLWFVAGLACPTFAGFALHTVH